MTGTAGVARLELRLLRAPALSAALLAGAAAGLRLTWPAALAGRGSGPLVSYLGLVLLVATGSVAAAHRTWSALEGIVPVRPLAIAATRLGVWVLGAAAVGAAGVVLLTDPADPSGLARRAAVVCTWTAVGGVVVVLATRAVPAARAGASAASRAAALLAGLGGLELLTTASRVFVEEQARPGTTDVLGELLPRGLGLAALALVVRRSEWRPSQSPKPVRPRPKLLGMLRRRPPRAAAPRRVARALLATGDLAGFRPILPVIWLPVVALLYVVTSAQDPGMRLTTGHAVLLVAGLGLLLVHALGRRAEGWSRSRAYPVDTRRAWVALGLVWGVLFLAAVAAGVAHRATHRVALAEAKPRAFRWPHAWHREVPLVGAAWLPQADLAGRPAGMPLPHPDGRWPLRAGGVPLADERVYLAEALSYYLARVHGVRVPPEALRAQLGAGFDVSADDVRLPQRAVAEFLAPLDLLVIRSPRRYRDLVDGPFPPGSEPDEAPPSRVLLVAPVTGQTGWVGRLSTLPGARALVRRQDGRMLVFHDEVERQEERLQDRLRRAAAWRFVLDACVLLLGVLLFARLRLQRSPRRWVLPLLPLAAVAMWWSQPAVAWRLAVRDAWLSEPWIGVAAIALALGLWAGSLRRALLADRLAHTA